MARQSLKFLCVALVIASPGHAAQWVGLGKSKGPVRVEVDAASRVSPAEQRVRLWHRETYSTPRIPDSGAFSYSRLTTLSEFQCDKRQSATLSQIYFAPDGSELKTETFEGRDTQPVAPDSPQEAVFNYACKPRVKPAPPPPPPPPPVVETPEPPKKKSGKKGQEEPPPPPPPHWSYGGNNGPERWGSLGKVFATCSQGERQSPIDIRKTIKADLPPIQFNYQPTGLSIVDNGHSIKVDTPGAGGINVDGEDYALQQFHFHKPSEEKINGKAYDLQMMEYASLAESVSNHPIAKSIQRACPDLDPRRVTEAKEIAGQGVKAKIDGHWVLAGNKKLMDAENVNMYQNAVASKFCMAL